MRSESNPDFGPQLEAKSSPTQFKFPFHPQWQNVEACGHCGYTQEAGFKFCVSCGKRPLLVIKQEQEDRADFNNSLRVLGFYGIYFAILMIISFTLNETYQFDLGVSIGDAIITLVFFFSIKGLWRIILPKKLHLQTLLTVLTLGIASPLLVHKLITFLTVHFKLIDYSLIDFTAPNPLLFALITTALFPAIFEELAFRGFLYHYLEKIGGAKMALLASSFLFAMVHFSMISLIWLFPFGLLVGYLRQKHNTLIYGIILHFMHNVGVILLDWNGY